MTKQEWAALCGEIQASWPHVELGPATIAAWYEDVEDLDAGPVRAAMVAHRRAGVAFPPTGGQLRVKAAELEGTGDGDPDRAWALIQEAIRKYGGDVGEYRGDGQDAIPASVLRDQYVAERDPRAAEVARIVGWDFLRGTGPDEYHEPSVRRAFRESYSAEAGRDRTRRQVADLGVGRAPRRIGDAIRASLEAAANGETTR